MWKFPIISGVGQKDIWGHGRSTVKTIYLLINAIFQERIHWWISYVMCWCTIVSGRMFEVLMKGKGHQRSLKLRLCEPCTHSITRKETWMNVILGIWLPHMKIEESNCLWWRSKVILGHQIVKVSNLLKMYIKQKNMFDWLDFTWHVMSKQYLAVMKQCQFETTVL